MLAGKAAKGSSALSETSERFKRAKARKKPVPVKRVVLSAEDKKAYEDLVRGRDERERDYGRHLAEERKGKR
jgi:hypothetical protein